MNHKHSVIDDTLVRRLISAQFPQWADLPVKPVLNSGWDNKTFTLGEHMFVRLPSAMDYEGQVEKEHRWLPKLAPLLPVPVPLAIGEPAEGYPCRWSVYRWLEGDTAASAYIGDLPNFAVNLALFLVALQRIDPTGGPMPGAHNFYRGGLLASYDLETRQAIAALKDKGNVEVATKVWETALATAWQGSPVWIHGDISAGNLLVHGGRLSAVIDFGNLGIGDPACDLAIAWTLFRDKSRKAFRTILSLDANTWARGRAWALWKASIVAAGLTQTNAVEAAQSWCVINEVLADYETTG